MDQSTLSIALPVEIEQDLISLETRTERLAEQSLVLIKSAGACALVAAIAYWLAWTQLPAEMISSVHIPPEVLKLFSEAQTVAKAGASFNDVASTLSGFMSGTLAKILALGMFIMGVGMGIVKQDVMPVVTAVAASLLLTYGPSVMETMVVDVKMEQGGKGPTISERSQLINFANSGDGSGVIRLVGGRAMDEMDRSYVLGQALLLSAGRSKKALNAEQRQDFEKNVATIEGGLEGGQPVKVLPSVLYVLEKEAYGNPRSKVVKDYIESVQSSQAVPRKVGGITGGLGGLIGAIGLGCLAISMHMRARMNRIKNLLGINEPKLLDGDDANS